MRSKRKLFLTLPGLGLAPLLLLAAFNYWGNVRTAKETLHRNQDRELQHFNSEIVRFLLLNRNELTKLSRARPLIEYVDASSQESKSDSVSHSTPAPAGTIGHPELQALVSSIVGARTNISRLAVFSRNNQPLFVAEQREYETYQPVDFRTKSFLGTPPQPDPRVWKSQQQDVLNSAALLAPFGSFITITAPVFGSGENSTSPVGALAAEVRLDPVFFEAARADKNLTATPQNMFIVVDRSGKVLYHTNESANHQPLQETMASLTTVITRMISEETGRASFTDTITGDEYAATYARLPPLDVFVARVANRDRALADAHRAGRTGIIAAVCLGILSGIALALYWQKKVRGIQRVSEGVEAMAQGKLDHRIDLRSRDDLKPLAANLEVMTRQLKEQLARDAETKQFQSFIRLSAILTHDLKNAIEALSLTVSNMERHSDNAAFRVDAMKTLRAATDDLRALVARLSNPVTTLSGEHKLPRPVDLVPVLRRVTSKVAVGGPHEVELKLPDSLIALVDVERIDKVVENLIINAGEAMSGRSGTITVEAGLGTDGKPFFSVSDAGVGMSRKFMEEQLFHPFATTKKRGVGLGLYTCREVIRANGGSIEVSSEKGIGTTFLVVLPSPPTGEGSEPVLRAHHRG